jgi:RNA polymerase sigma-70 factor (ECF subfamily)
VTDEPVDPLPPDIAALIERERLAYPEDPSAKAAMLSRLELAVALGGGGGGHGRGGDGGAPESQAPTLLARGARVLVAVACGAFVTGGVVGSVVTQWSRSGKPAPPTVACVASAAPPPDLGQTTEGDDAQEPLASQSVETGADAAAPPAAVVGSTALRADAGQSRQARDGRGDLTRERELLDVARAALGRGHAADAIAAAERHARQWPSGYLVEEREAVWIEALAEAGRRGEAEQKATTFRKLFPRSMLLPAVEAAVGGQGR